MDIPNSLLSHHKHASVRPCAWQFRPNSPQGFSQLPLNWCSLQLGLSELIKKRSGFAFLFPDLWIVLSLHLLYFLFHFTVERQKRENGRARWGEKWEHRTSISKQGDALISLEAQLVLCISSRVRSQTVWFKNQVYKLWDPGQMTYFSVP